MSGYDLVAGPACPDHQKGPHFDSATMAKKRFSPSQSRQGNGRRPFISNDDFMSSDTTADSACEPQM